MSRRIIPITRACYLNAFTEVLSTIGSVLPTRADRYGLPAVDSEHGNRFIPVLPAVKFLDLAARHEGISDLCFRGVESLSVQTLDNNFLDALKHHTTLYDALKTFCSLASIEDNCVHLWMERCGSMLRVCSALCGVGRDAPLEYSQWLQTKIPIEVVRLYLGPRWAPQTLALEADRAFTDYEREAWPGTTLLSGQSASWFDIPIAQLAAPPLSGLSSAGSVEETVLLLPPRDLIGVLRLLLPSYLGSGYLPIAKAAAITETSVRTLQRELAKAALNYSQLLDQVRFEMAVKLLRDPDIRILDVAHNVGYDDPTHFTRMFRRMCGSTPRAYRTSLEMP